MELILLRKGINLPLSNKEEEVMETEMWYRDDCEECGKVVGWGNLTAGGLCEECEYKGE